jgi:hypothetical protein
LAKERPRIMHRGAVPPLARSDILMDAVGGGYAGALYPLHGEKLQMQQKERREV